MLGFVPLPILSASTSSRLTQKLILLFLPLVPTGLAVGIGIMWAALKAFPPAALSTVPLPGGHRTGESSRILSKRDHGSGGGGRRRLHRALWMLLEAKWLRFFLVVEFEVSS